MVNVKMIMEIANNGFVDDNDKLEWGIDDISGFGIFIKGDNKFLCPIYLGNCILRPFIKNDDGRIHLSIASVGGFVNTSKYPTIDEACKNYSDWDGNKIIFIPIE